MCHEGPGAGPYRARWKLNGDSGKTPSIHDYPALYMEAYGMSPNEVMATPVVALLRLSQQLYDRHRDRNKD